MMKAGVKTFIVAAALLTLVCFANTAFGRIRPALLLGDTTELTYNDCKTSQEVAKKYIDANIVKPSAASKKFFDSTVKSSGIAKIRIKKLMITKVATEKAIPVLLSLFSPSMSDSEIKKFVTQSQ